MPLIMEVIDLRSKIEPLLFEVKRMVGDNGLVTVQEFRLFNAKILRQGIDIGLSKVILYL